MADGIEHGQVGTAIRIGLGFARFYREFFANPLDGSNFFPLSNKRRRHSASRHAVSELERIGHQLVEPEEAYHGAEHKIEFSAEQNQPVPLPSVFLNQLRRAGIERRPNHLLKQSLRQAGKPVLTHSRVLAKKNAVE